MDFNGPENYYFHMYGLSHHIFIVIPSGFTDLHIRSLAQTYIGYPYDAIPLVHSGHSNNFLLTEVHHTSAIYLTPCTIHIFIASHITQTHKTTSDPTKGLTGIIIHLIPK